MSKFEYTKDEKFVKELESRIAEFNIASKNMDTLMLPEDVRSSVKLEIDRQIAIINNVISNIMNRD